MMNYVQDILTLLYNAELYVLDTLTLLYNDELCSGYFNPGIQWWTMFRIF